MSMILFTQGVLWDQNECDSATSGGGGVGGLDQIAEPQRTGKQNDKPSILSSDDEQIKGCQSADQCGAVQTLVIGADGKILVRSPSLA